MERFLGDEVQDLPLAAQPKLLRAIERHEVVPVGETQPIKIDVRLVCASQESLVALVAEGRFRPDLQARLEGLTIELPPLRARREDIVPLCVEFLRHAAQTGSQSLDSRLAEALCIYDWPLNVHELQLLARRVAAVLRQQSVLRREHLPPHLRDHATTPVKKSSAAAAKCSGRQANDEEKFAALTDALRANQGNVSRAASAIGIGWARAYRLLAAQSESISLAEGMKSHRIGAAPFGHCSNNREQWL